MSKLEYQVAKLQRRASAKRILAMGIYDKNPPTDEMVIVKKLESIDRWEVKQIVAILKVEVAKARHESFLGARLGCSFNPDCKSCRANKLSLNYLVDPETAEADRNAYNAPAYGKARSEDKVESDD